MRRETIVEQVRMTYYGSIACTSVPTYLIHCLSSMARAVSDRWKEEIDRPYCMINGILWPSRASRRQGAGVAIQHVIRLWEDCQDLAWVSHMSSI